jgi:predicted membrane protein
MRVVIGAILILLGLLFLFDNIGIYRLDFVELIEDYWPLVLIAIGAALIYRQTRSTDDGVWEEAVRGHHSKSLGDMKLRPQTVPAQGLSVKHGLGDLHLDLSGCSFNDGENRIECSLGAGDAGITVPTGVPLKASCSIGVGEVYLLGSHREGVGPSLEHEDEGYATAARKINLRVKIGFGECRVVHP